MESLFCSSQPCGAVKGRLSNSKVRIIQGWVCEKRHLTTKSNCLNNDLSMQSDLSLRDRLHQTILSLPAEQQSFQFCKTRLPKQITNRGWQHPSNPWLGCRWCCLFPLMVFKILRHIHHDVKAGQCAFNSLLHITFHWSYTWPEISDWAHKEKAPVVLWLPNHLH